MEKRQRAGIGLVLAALTGLSACGTRIPHSRVVADSDGAIVRLAAGADQGASTSPVPGGTGADTPGGSGPAAAATTTGADPTAPGPGAQPSVAGVPRSSPGAAAATAKGGARPSPGKASAGTTKADTSPVNLGMIGDFTNSVSANGAPSSKDAILAWVKDTNAHGGLKGHPIDLFIEDTQTSATVALQDAQDLVQNKHVIAFVGNYTSYETSIEPYLRNLKIPILGGAVGEDIWETSPIMIGPTTQPQTGPFAEGTIAVKEANGNVGIIYCVEQGKCTTVADQAMDPKTGVGQAGAKVVYSAQSSIAQPDFTTECLAAQNAKVGFLFVVMDAASVGRVAASCARQGYHPLFSSGLNEDSIAQDPNLDGHYAQIYQTFTWTQTATAAQRAYQAWVGQYGLQRGPGSTTEWLAGAILQRAARDITGPITSAGLLAGIYTIKAETFDGLLPGPISMAPTGITALTCLQTQTAKGGHLVDDNGGKAICAP